MVRKFGMVIDDGLGDACWRHRCWRWRRRRRAAGGGARCAAGLIALAANLGIGIAAFGSALGQGRMVASAMESIGRNPNSAGQIFTPMIIGLAFIEALTLYALVIAFFLQAKI